MHGASEARFPRPGDYLLEMRDGRWRVGLVDDLVALRKLVPLVKDDAVVELVDQPVDSVTPAYEGEVYALTRQFDNLLTSRDEAVQAIRDGSLGDGRAGVLVRLDGPAAATLDVFRAES